MNRQIFQRASQHFLGQTPPLATIRQLVADVFRRRGYVKRGFNWHKYAWAFDAQRVSICALLVHPSVFIDFIFMTQM